MWKITVLLIACYACNEAQARPGYLHTAVLPAPHYEQHLEYAPTVVGHTLHSIPTAVSHQSQTIVHEKRPYLRPIIEHTPILQTYAPHTAALGLPVTYTAYPGLYDHAAWAPGLSTVYGSDWTSSWPLK